MGEVETDRDRDDRWPIVKFTASSNKTKTIEYILFLLLLLQAQFHQRFHTKKSSTQGEQNFVAQGQSNKIDI